jgi:hypothetical protein
MRLLGEVIPSPFLRVTVHGCRLYSSRLKKQKAEIMGSVEDVKIEVYLEP